MSDHDTAVSDLEALQREVTRLRDGLRRAVGFEEGAWGVDGHGFSYEIALSRPLPVGGYVQLSTRDGRRYLGQVIDQHTTSRPGPQVSVDVGSTLRGTAALGAATVTVNMRLVSGDGLLLARLAEPFSPVDRHATFDIADIEEAPPELVDDFIIWSLGGGTGLDTAGASFGTGAVLPLLGAKGFNRHTFLCGQSGSGKTYSLGVLLERLLLHTTITMVVLDPNSDYVGLADLLPAEASGAAGDAYDRVRRHWEQLRDRVVVLGAAGTTAFKGLFGRLTIEQQALVLGLEPVRDAEAYAAFRALRDAAGRDVTMSQFLAHAEGADDQAMTSLARRIRNLGAATWDVWAEAGDTPVLDALPPDYRLIVADLGSVSSTHERSVQSAAVLGWLWQHRHERVPRLVVIDEAHNVCPQRPDSPLASLATEHVIRIAAEGRKYGLYLLLSTQQPQKIHANVLSQCDNLILLRMNSSVDTDHLARVFGFVPAPLLRQANGFRLGEGLVAGKITSHPMRVQGARRWTREGGADVPTTWARPAGPDAAHDRTPAAAHGDHGP